MFAAAMKMLKEAMSRHDQQKPKRALLISRMNEARRHRRPGSPTVPGLGGPGWPGT
jgi:hypothetical protein